MKKNMQGFTLIELMIVVVIVGLLLSVSIPSVGRQVSTDRANRSAAVILGMLDEAGQLAVRRSQPVTVTFSSGTLNIADRGSGTVLKSRSFGGANDLKGTVVLNPSTGVTIFPNGRGSAALTVTVTGGSATATVSRTATGILRRD
jgi:prepilin-type N-terminal cleavage/methylation domain-containing protein